MSPIASGPPRRTLIKGGLVLPMTPGSGVIEEGSVLIEGEWIIAVGPDELIEADERNHDAEVIHAFGNAVLPGLTNAHLHSGLLRGTAESLSLWDWLETYVDPTHRVLTPEIAAIAARHCYAESLLAGTTSVVDMWRYLEGAAEAAGDLGIRATLVPYVADAEGYDYFETLDTTRILLDGVGTAVEGRVRSWVGIEHLFYATERCFAEAVALAEEYGVGFHTHSSESIWEVQESLRRWGRRPIEVMYQLGVLGPQTLIAHCVWLDDREIALLAQTGTSVAHCPCSNMKLASGPARVAALRNAGVTVGLGSDGEKENNNLDMFEEMKFASLLQKVSTLDPTVGDPWDVLSMATIEGATAIGLGEVTGTLEVGKRADIVTVDLSGLHTTPLLHGTLSNVAAHLVFSASGRDVRDVLVDGHVLVRAGIPLTFDVHRIRAESQLAAEELFERRARLDPPVRTHRLD